MYLVQVNFNNDFPPVMHMHRKLRVIGVKYARAKLNPSIACVCVTKNSMWPRNMLLGGFSNEIKTEIRYLMIGGYHNLIR